MTMSINSFSGMVSFCSQDVSVERLFQENFKPDSFPEKINMFNGSYQLSHIEEVGLGYSLAEYV